MRRVRVIAAVGAVLLLVSAARASATEFVVNSVNDPGTGTCDVAECTFREALAAANTGGVRDDVITFDVTGQFISALTPFPSIQSAATQGKLLIDGPGADTLTIRRSTGNFGVLSNLSGADTTIRGVTISGGATASGSGGGIHNSGTLLLERVAVLDNNSNGGGGVNNDSGGILTLRASTVAGNTANPNYTGAGIYLLAGQCSSSSVNDHRQPGARGVQLRRFYSPSRRVRPAFAAPRSRATPPRRSRPTSPSSGARRPSATRSSPTPHRARSRIARPTASASSSRPGSTSPTTRVAG